MITNTANSDNHQFLNKPIAADLYTMKNFLFPTDFSANATHALDYGYSLAKQVKANIIICNAITVPAEMPQSGFVGWPAEESEMLLLDSRSELKLLKKHLEDKEQTISFNPAITYENQAGTVIDLVADLEKKYDTGLVIIGTHGKSQLSTLLLGNHSRELIDAANRPLLLIPPAAKIKPIKKIAFATDLKNIAEDLKCIYQLITLARPLNAEILIMNIFDDEQHDPKNLMDELSNNANYPQIYYRLVKAYRPEAGLDWMCEHGLLDMVAMVHRDHDFIDRFFGGSQTQKMAENTTTPLLVFPATT
jgi:nucleotide-binding universal stress UspA family protein